MQTTPPTLSSTFILRREREFLTAGKMFLATCSRFAFCSFFLFFFSRFSIKKVISASTSLYSVRVVHRVPLTGISAQRWESSLSFGWLTSWKNATDMVGIWITQNLSQIVLTLLISNDVPCSIPKTHTSRSHLCQLSGLSLCAGYEEESFGFPAFGRTQRWNWLWVRLL